MSLGTSLFVQACFSGFSTSIEPCSTFCLFLTQSECRFQNLAVELNVDKHAVTINIVIILLTWFITRTIAASNKQKIISCIFVWHLEFPLQRDIENKIFPINYSFHCNLFDALGCMILQAAIIDIWLYTRI